VYGRPAIIFCAIAGPTPGRASSSASLAVFRSSLPLALAVVFFARPPRLVVVAPVAAGPAVVAPEGEPVVFGAVAEDVFDEALLDVSVVAAVSLLDFFEWCFDFFVVDV
jgi:hypothetical protein